MKKLIITIIVFIMIIPVYIGVHRIIFSEDYKTISKLTNNIYDIKLSIIKYQTKV